MWIRLVEKHGLGDYIGSLRTIYEVYKKNEEFNEEIFVTSLKVALNHHDNEDEFFQTFMNTLNQNVRRSFIM